MLAPPDSTSDTMLDALATTLCALLVAVDIDVDRTPADRAFFSENHAALTAHYAAVEAAELALRKHEHLVQKRRQLAVVLGDQVLDRAVRAGKARMKLELRLTAPDAAEQVFSAEVAEIVDVEMKTEPNLVLEAAAKFSLVPDFAGKDALKADLEARAARQTLSFTERSQAEITKTGLRGEVERAVSAASDALYGLEKRLLARFVREKKYVKTFFLDVSPPRKKGAEAPPA